MAGLDLEPTGWRELYAALDGSDVEALGALPVPLADGQRLSFATNLPSTNSGFSYQYLISMLVMAFFIVAISIWAVRRARGSTPSRSAASAR